MPSFGTCLSRIWLFTSAWDTGVAICTAIVRISAGSACNTFLRDRMLRWAESKTTSCPADKYPRARSIMIRWTRRYPWSVISLPNNSFRMASELICTNFGCYIAQVVLPAPGTQTNKYRVALIFLFSSILCILVHHFPKIGNWTFICLCGR